MSIINNDNKEEKLFVTFTSGDFFDKPDVSDEECSGLSNLFKSDCKKGVLWAIPVDKDWRKTIVNIACTAINYVGFMLVFKSDDYHKIDKLKWEEYVSASDGTKPNAYLDFINDDLPDDYCEFIIPYTTTGSVLACYWFAIDSMDFDERFFSAFDDWVSVVPGFVDEVVLRKEYMRNAMKKYSFFSPLDGESYDINDDDVDGKLKSSCFYKFFVPYVLPLFISGYSSHVGGSEPVLMGSWVDYVDKYLDKYMRNLNDVMKFFLDGNCADKFDKYDLLREPIFDFFTSSASVADARVSGYGRNEVCPCGSGLKWKKCCGKIYS